MIALVIVSLLIAAVAVAWAVRFWIELKRWARLMKGGRIVVAYKRRVRYEAPLQEWALWCRKLDDDKDARGRVIWREGHASVAITKAVIPPGRIRRALARRKPAPAPAVSGARTTSRPPAADRSAVVG